MVTIEVLLNNQTNTYKTIDRKKTCSIEKRIKVIINIYHKTF